MLADFQRARIDTMKHPYLLAITLLFACRDSYDDDTFATSETSGVASDSDAGDDDTASSTAAEAGSSTSSETSDGGDGDDSSSSGPGDGDSDSDSGTAGTNSESGDSDAGGVTSGDGDSDGMGDGDGETSETGMGTQKFPGENCDPFVDACIDGYECTMNVSSMFVCITRTDEYPEHDGLYGSRCNENLDLVCKTGLICRAAAELPEGDCDHVACCAEVCAFGDACDGGLACEVLWWTETLPDHMDPYGGIGFCG